jgi:glycosyltransferase involved in cell wall biosynthesis
MRILWVKVGGLWPLNTGGRLRSFHILSELSHRHRVTVATTHGPGDDPEGLAVALPQCERVITIPYAAPKLGTVRFAAALLRSWLSPFPVDFWRWRVPALSHQVTRIIHAEDVDLCVADFLVSTPNVPLSGRVPVALFAHNVEHMIWKRLSEVEPRRWRRAVFNLEWPKVRWWEAQACARAGLTVAVSEPDREMLAALGPGTRVCAIPTGVDPTYFAPSDSSEGSAQLVFTGSMDWYPNEDAITYFVDAILPLIRREIPQAALTVVGRNPTPQLRQAAADAGVSVTGTADDIRPYVAEAAVYVVPLRIGGGTRLKIFEALAMGKAVVSTRVGAEGLPLVPGVHFLQADDPAEFAHAVVTLFRDPARRRALGVAGRQLVAERFSWSQVAREFEARCTDVLASSPQGRDRKLERSVRACV